MDDPFPFESFPFRKLEIKIPRRGMLSSVLQQVIGIASSLNEKPTYHIEDLGMLSLGDLLDITPALFPGCDFKSDEAYVYGKAPKHTVFTRLFQKQSQAHAMFQYFNPALSIGEISQLLLLRFPMDEKESQLFVRGLFLFLIEEGFAYPSAGVPDHA